MLNRRSFLSSLLLPAAVGSGLVAAGEASGRSSGREFVGVDSWFNTDQPLTVAGLRGTPLLVEFGTYTCINWRRTLPYANRWHSEYGPQGLRIVGIHTPEFSFERTRAYIEHELRALGVSFPVIIRSPSGAPDRGARPSGKTGPGMREPRKIEHPCPNRDRVFEIPGTQTVTGWP